jgi:carbon-monoxide dehydrogenase small subunit
VPLLHPRHRRDPLASRLGCVALGTIEGLADGDKLHPVQQAFIDTGAVQCGYCTPGYIMSVKALLDRTTKPTAADIEEAVSGNICRCTGYNKIVDAIHLAASKL